jgi:hypothetical protein
MGNCPEFGNASRLVHLRTIGWEVLWEVWALAMLTKEQPGPLRIAGAVERSEPVTFTVDGKAVTAFAGESLAAALFAAGIRRLRASPRAQTPRGMFCLMGVCQECVLWVDGRRVPACREPVRAGMTVSTGPTP